MKLQSLGTGISFTKHQKKVQTPFERLFEIFKELITHTSGDFDEAIDWLRELDKEYKLTDEDYTIDDFIEDLLKKSYIKQNNQKGGNGEGLSLTPKTEKLLRKCGKMVSVVEDKEQVCSTRASGAGKWELGEV